MKANELSIGNCVELLTPCNPVRLPSGIYGQVFSIDYTGIKVIDPNILPAQQVPVFLKWYEFIEIPLTEQWLLDLGFDDKDYKDGFIGIEYRSNLIVDFVLTKPNTLGEWQKHFVFELNKIGFVQIKYVHELQNLYFALTGEELTLKKNIDI